MNIWLSRLQPNLTRWSDPVRISEDDERSEQNPLLWLDHDSRLHLLHTAQTVRQADEWSADGPFSMQWTARLRTRTSSDHGHTWSTTRDLLHDEAFCRHPPLPHPEGGWILPIYRSLAEGSQFGHDYSQVAILNPDLSISCIHSVPHSTGRVHGSLVVSSDGKALLQFFRSRLADNIYFSVGRCDGSGWAEPQAISLPNNNSSIQALRLASGRLALIFNRFCMAGVQPIHWGEAYWPHTRWPLSIALSEDEGMTWPWICDIDAGLGFCGDANWHHNIRLEYPSILEGPSGVLHITYSWGNQAAIRYLRLHEDSLIGT